MKSKIFFILNTMLVSYRLRFEFMMISIQDFAIITTSIYNMQCTA